MTRDELLGHFTDKEAWAHENYNRILAIIPDHKPTVGKHEAITHAHLANVLAEADKSCPKAADTIRWILWHNILNAQWYIHMAKMLPDAEKEDS
jgi:hypothetical protein